jgi:gliding motility-associated-like protein
MFIRLNKIVAYLLIFLASTSAFSQVKINEYSCANVSGTGAFVDAFGNTPDWFELYNPSTFSRNISGFYLSNDVSEVGKWQLPIGTVIPPQGFLVIYASGKDTVIQGANIQYHTNFELNQTKPDLIIVANNAGTIVDSVTIRKHQHNHAWGRVPNGSTAWRVFPKNSTGNATATPGATNVGVKAYVDYLPTPKFDVNGGFFQGPLQLNLSYATNSILTLLQPQIYFTGAGFYDGADPSVSGTTKKRLFDLAFPVPIPIDSTTIIRAFLDTSDLSGLPNSYLPSFVETKTYIINNTKVFTSNGLPINTDFNMSVVSLSYDTLSVGSFPGASAGVPHKYMLSLEYFDKSKNLKLKSIGGASAPSLDDALPNSLGGITFYAEDEFGYNYTNNLSIYNDAGFPTSTRQTQKYITLRAAGSDKFPLQFTPTSFPSHIRDAVAHTYALKNNINVDASRYQPCVLFLNGKYWGVYEIRERFDEEFVSHYYNSKKENVQLLIKDGALQGFNTSQAQSDWGYLYQLVTENDMSNDTLYEKVDSLLDVSSLIDLVLYTNFLANGEFPLKAAWFRVVDTSGIKVKWRYHLNDMDDVLGLNKNSSTFPNINPDLTFCQHEFVYGTSSDSSLAHLTIFKSLLANQQFKSKYVNRYSYLQTTSFRCLSLSQYITTFQNSLKNQMIQHCYRWGANDTIWNLCVDTMKYWVNQRCNNLTDDLKNCYNVTGPYRFCVEIEPAGSGALELNEVPFYDENTVNYFGNVNFTAVARPSENYYFDHWEPKDFSLSSTQLKTDSISWFFQNISCLKAVFKLKEAHLLTGEPAVPTGFSPNGDGNNDVLNVYGTLKVSDFKLEIYNRWGEKLFTTTDKSKGWDGTYNGVNVPVGVYAYIYRVNLDGKIIQKSGSVTLIR